MILVVLLFDVLSWRVVATPNIVIERQFCCVSGPSAESVKPGNGLSSKVLGQAGALLLKRQRQLGALVVHGTRLTAGSLHGLVISFAAASAVEVGVKVALEARMKVAGGKVRPTGEPPPPDGIPNDPAPQRGA